MPLICIALFIYINTSISIATLKHNAEKFFFGFFHYSLNI